VETGNDCQAAEDHKPPVGCVCTAWLKSISQAVLLDVPEPSTSCSIRANPAKAGDAKLRAYRWRQPWPPSRRRRRYRFSDNVFYITALRLRWGTLRSGAA